MSGHPEDRTSWSVQLRPWARGWELWVDGAAVTQTSRGEGAGAADPEVMMREWIALTYERDASNDMIEFRRET